MKDQLIGPERSNNATLWRTPPRDARAGRGRGTCRDKDRDVGLLQVLPAVPGSVRRSRVEFAEWLAGLRWPGDDADDLVLAVSEAVSNVVDHAYPERDPGPVGLHAWCGTGASPATRRITVAVIDHGNWDHAHRTIDPGGHRGHGLAVMRACTAEMRIQRSASGTTVILVSNDAPLIESSRGNSGPRP